MCVIIERRDNLFPEYPQNMTVIISATFVIISWKLSIPLNFLTDLVNAHKAGISNANTRGAAQQQAN